MIFAPKKSTSTTTANTTSSGFSEIKDGSTAFAINGSSNTVSMLDGGAIKDAFDFARNASDSSFGIASQVAKSSVEIASQVAAKSVSDTGDKLANTMKWLIAGLVLIAGMQMMKKGRA